MSWKENFSFLKEACIISFSSLKGTPYVAKLQMLLDLAGCLYEPSSSFMEGNPLLQANSNFPLISIWSLY